jgi:hypothetical protein
MRIADLDYYWGRFLCLLGAHQWYHGLAYPRHKTCLKCGKKRKGPG